MSENVLHQDFLACYPYLLERLKNIPQIKAVKEAQDLADLSNERGAVAPLDGVVYVIFDGFTPLDEVNAGKDHALEIGFSLILVKAMRSTQPNIAIIGETLTAIAKSLQGFEPKNEYGNYLTVSPFIQRKAIPIRYERGFGFFALRFTTNVVILGDE